MSFILSPPPSSPKLIYRERRLHLPFNSKSHIQHNTTYCNIGPYSAVTLTSVPTCSSYCLKGYCKQVQTPNMFTSVINCPIDVTQTYHCPHAASVNRTFIANCWAIIANCLSPERKIICSEKLVFLMSSQDPCMV